MKVGELELEIEFDSETEGGCPESQRLLETADEEKRNATIEIIDKEDAEEEEEEEEKDGTLPRDSVQLQIGTMQAAWATPTGIEKGYASN